MYYYVMKKCDVVIKYRTIKIVCNKKCDTLISTEHFYISFSYIICLSMSCHHTKDHNGNRGLPMFMLSLVLGAWS